MYNTEALKEGAYTIALHDMTVRAAAKKVGVGKTTLHHYITKELRDEDFILADEVEAKLAQHLATRHLRGGEATKAKYQSKRVTI